MHIRRIFVLVFGVLTLGGCAFSTPFKTYDPASLSSDGETQVVVSITLAVVKDDEISRETFWRSVENVADVLPTQPGVIGSSRRFELFGNQAWTMTVWRDEEALNTFMKSPEHRAAVKNALNTLEDAKFLRRTVSVNDVPLAWDDAVADVATEGRRYYE